ncbi:MAG: hypothetical protein PHW64_01245 [Sulfuricurvum sp.]|nr:hypothetical protein [Sulfuricurvum sp.]
MIAWLYRKIFIAIVPDGTGHDVQVRVYKQKKLLFKENKRFEGVLPKEEMLSYIQKQCDESPLFYIALLNPENNQGGLAGCSTHESSEALSGAKTLCRNKKWLLYASIRELEGLKKRYDRVGLDYIFSPFSVLERFFADKISEGFALYALAQKNSFSIAFFEGGKLEYAHHYPMNLNYSLELEDEEIGAGFGFAEEEEEVEEQGIDLDEIESLDDLDILDELDDLSDIEDLDSLDEIIEFSEDAPTFEEKRAAVPRADEVKGEMERFGNDYSRFEFIQKTLAHFYAGEYCHGRFVETVYIADAYGSGTELKRYLEEELFLNVLIRKIDVVEEVAALAITEEEES